MKQLKKLTYKKMTFQVLLKVYLLSNPKLLARKLYQYQPVS